jgi:hypothetical protein
MTTNAGKPPDKCPNPECGNESRFTRRNVRFQCDARHEMGTLEAQQIPRCRIITWECDDCHCQIDVVLDL